MWVQVRMMDGKESFTVDSLSRLTKVEELRRRVQELFHVEPSLQRLFYRGKQVGVRPGRQAGRLTARPSVRPAPPRPATFVLAWVQAPRPTTTPRPALALQSRDLTDTTYHPHHACENKGQGKLAE